MPTVQDITPHVDEIASAVSSISGVNAVYVHGSFLTHAEQPNYPLKDIDIIAATNFDSGDLMAIDAGADSPLKMASSEWENLGFNADAVQFTKRFLGMRQYNIDHWATSRDGKLLHWGAMSENIEDWKAIHEEAESYAQRITGYNRLKLAKQDDLARTHWREVYTASINKYVTKTDRLIGWLPSDHPAEEVLSTAKKLR